MIEIDMPNGVRMRVGNGVDLKVLRRHPGCSGWALMLPAGEVKIFLASAPPT